MTPASAATAPYLSPLGGAELEYDVGAAGPGLGEALHALRHQPVLERPLYVDLGPHLRAAAATKRARGVAIVADSKKGKMNSKRRSGK